MPRARVNGVAMHYQQTGQGPDLVLVHGLFCNLAFWYLTAVPLLAGRFRITVYDLRGHGFTERPGSGYRALDLADDLFSLLEHLGIERAHLLGHSFGGAVALACAVRHPDRCASITLADAWIPSLQPLGGAFWQAQRDRLEAAGVKGHAQLPRVAYGFFEELLEQPQDAATRRLTAGLLDARSGVAGADSRLHKKWWQLMEQTSATRELSDGTGLQKRDLAAIATPSLAVFGRRSKFLPTLHALEGVLPHLTSRTISGAGHFFPLLKPGLLVDELNGFVEGVRTQAQAKRSPVQSDYV